MSSFHEHGDAQVDKGTPGGVLMAIALTATLLVLALLAGGAQVFERHVRTIRRRNRARRRALIRKLGLSPLYTPLSTDSSSVITSSTQVRIGPLAQLRNPPSSATPPPPTTTTTTKAGDVAPPPTEDGYTIVGFLHPHANGGGGGERVLFHALDWVLREHPTAICVVYTGDVHPDSGLGSKFSSSTLNAVLSSVPSARATAVQIAQASGNTPIRTQAPDGTPYVTGPAILEQASKRFGVKLAPKRVFFLPIKSRHLLGDSWKRLTLAGQAFGAAMVASEAMAQVIPDVLIDTTGLAFAAPMTRMYNKQLPIASYTHYPAITRTMLQRVQRRQAGHTNSAAVAGSTWRSYAKLLYYRGFARVYTWALGSPDALVANGSWTRAQLRALLYPRNYDLASQLVPAPLARPYWNSAPKEEDVPKQGKKTDVSIVYPPVDVAALAAAPLDPPRGRTGIVSLAQFRPEKEHATQLYALATLHALQLQPPSEDPTTEPHQDPLPLPTLTLIGGVRNQQDERRVAVLKQLASDLGVADHVNFVVNAPWDQVKELLAHASIGFSTMIDEHFGIGVVEFMAAGLITLSHTSAGPWLDIALPEWVPNERGAYHLARTGYHASDVDSYAAMLDAILRLPADEALDIRQRARARTQRVFSADAFESAFAEYIWAPLTNRLLAQNRKAQ